MGWDKYHMDGAIQAASKSKDPNSKVGCLIVGEHNERRASGFNGFARGVTDLPARYLDRDLKLQYVVHAEANTIAFAARVGVSFLACTAYVTKFPCASCASLMIQAGISHVVAPEIEKGSSWAESNRTALHMLREAGVEVRFYGG